MSIPYDVGVDLSGVSESRLGYGKVPKLEISSLFSTIADVRDWLASQYPAETYPDIHKIVTDGNVLIRICSTSRLPMILMRGTDRDGSSSLSSGGIDDEESTVSAYNYNAGNVTYASLKTPETKNNNGDDTFMLTGYGGVMLIYDPRKLVKLGNTSNGLSAFTAPPSTALLGIIQSVHPSAGARPTEDDLKAYLEYSEERRKALRR